MNDLDDYAKDIPPAGHPQLAKIVLFSILLVLVLASCDYVLL